MKISVKLCLMQGVALFVLTVAMVVSSVMITVDKMNSMTEQELAVAVEGFHGDVNYLRSAGNDVDITVFEGDTRVESSIEGVVGTKAAAQVIEAVLKNNKTYFDTDVTIGGEPYYGYYKPVDGGMLFAGEPKADVVSAIMHIVMTEIVVGVICFALCMTFSTVLSLRIAKGISRASQKVKTLAKGDLSAPVAEAKSDSKDEVVQINNAVNDLHRQLKEIVYNIKNEAAELNQSNVQFSDRFDSISEGISNVNIAVEEIAQGATNQAGETTQAAAQVNDMAGVVEENTANVNNLERNIAKMTELFEEAEKIFAELQEMFDYTASTVDAVAQKTKETNNSAEKINEAVNLIKDITSQTSLLSLNASIEAARAGEAGRGFAVVADEIRKLSDSSAASAQTIEEIVSELIENSDANMKEIAEVTNATNRQKDKLGATVNAFEGLKVEADSVAEVSKSIAGSTQALRGQKNNIAGVIENLSAISQQDAASCQETSASMQGVAATVDDCSKEVKNLAVLSDRLNEQVARFKLD